MSQESWPCKNIGYNFYIALMIENSNSAGLYIVNRFRRGVKLEFYLNFQLNRPIWLFKKYKDCIYIIGWADVGGG